MNDVSTNELLFFRFRYSVSYLSVLEPIISHDPSKDDIFQCIHTLDSFLYQQLGVVPLPDNHPRDHYCYEITVYTGYSAEAGTTANINFILKGSRDETPVRILKDANDDCLTVGSIKYFLLTAPFSLGKLQGLRIWHDNEGRSPSWYLLRVMVSFILDIFQTNESEQHSIVITYRFTISRGT